MDMEKRLAPFLEVVGWAFIAIGFVIFFSALYFLAGVVHQACFAKLQDDSEFVGHAVGAALSLLLLLFGWLFVRGARKIKNQE